MAEVSRGRDKKKVSGGYGDRLRRNAGKRAESAVGTHSLPSQFARNCEQNATKNLLTAQDSLTVPPRDAAIRARILINIQRCAPRECRICPCASFTSAPAIFSQTHSSRIFGLQRPDDYKASHDGFQLNCEVYILNNERRQVMLENFRINLRHPLHEMKDRPTSLRASSLLRALKTLRRLVEKRRYAPRTNAWRLSHCLAQPTVISGWRF